MEYLYVSIPVIFDERQSMWWELVIPGIFTLFGSLIGAWLAGRYAVNSVKEKLKYDKNSNRISVLEPFLKQSFILTSHYKKILDYAKEADDSITKDVENDFVSDESIYLINELIYMSKGTSKDLSQIDIELVPFDVYYKFQSSISLIKEFSLKTESFLTDFLRDDEPEESDHIIWSFKIFTDYLYKLNQDYEYIKSYEKESYNELNKIKDDI